MMANYKAAIARAMLHFARSKSLHAKGLMDASRISMQHHLGMLDAIQIMTGLPREQIERDCAHV